MAPCRAPIWAPIGHDQTCQPMEPTRCRLILLHGCSRSCLTSPRAAPNGGSGAFHPRDAQRRRPASIPPPRPGDQRALHRRASHSRCCRYVRNACARRGGLRLTFTPSPTPACCPTAEGRQNWLLRQRALPDTPSRWPGPPRHARHPMGNYVIAGRLHRGLMTTRLVQNAGRRGTHRARLISEDSP